MFEMHPGARAEPLLAAWGITATGALVILALAAGGRESSDAWGDFLDELTGRGLRPPLLVISRACRPVVERVKITVPHDLRRATAPPDFLIP